MSVSICIFFSQKITYNKLKYLKQNLITYRLVSLGCSMVSPFFVLMCLCECVFCKTTSTFWKQKKNTTFTKTLTKRGKKVGFVFSNVCIVLHETHNKQTIIVTLTMTIVMITWKKKKFHIFFTM